MFDYIMDCSGVLLEYRYSNPDSYNVQYGNVNVISRWVVYWS